MNIFHLHAEKQHGGMRNAATWLVIADSLFDAISSIPEGLSVKAVGGSGGCGRRSGRVIGRPSVPTIH